VHWFIVKRFNSQPQNVVLLKLIKHGSFQAGVSFAASVITSVTISYKDRNCGSSVMLGSKKKESWEDENLGTSGES
jgi:hypothetical protein